MGGSDDAGESEDSLARQMHREEALARIVAILAEPEGERTERLTRICGELRAALGTNAASVRVRDDRSESMAIGGFVGYPPGSVQREVPWSVVQADGCSASARSTGCGRARRAIGISSPRCGMGSGRSTPRG
jgi:hypothetical protein